MYRNSVSIKSGVAHIPIRRDRQSSAKQITQTQLMVSRLRSAFRYCSQEEDCKVSEYLSSAPRKIPSTP